MDRAGDGQERHAKRGHHRAGLPEPDRRPDQEREHKVSVVRHPADMQTAERAHASDEQAE